MGENTYRPKNTVEHGDVDFVLTLRDLLGLLQRLLGRFGDWAWWGLLSLGRFSAAFFSKTCKVTILPHIWHQRPLLYIRVVEIVHTFRQIYSTLMKIHKSQVTHLLRLSQRKLLKGSALLLWTCCGSCPPFSGVPLVLWMASLWYTLLYLLSTSHRQRGLTGNHLAKHAASNQRAKRGAALWLWLVWLQMCAWAQEVKYLGYLV